MSRQVKRKKHRLPKLFALLLSPHRIMCLASWFVKINALMTMQGVMLNAGRTLWMCWRWINGEVVDVVSALGG